MKSLIIERLIIISQVQNRAKIIDFDSKLTILISQDENGNSYNRTGKSFVMKSIFHSFGAALKQYPVNWDSMDICTIMHFTYAGNKYKIYRNANKFVVIDNKGVSEKFDSISKLRDFYVELFDFNIKLIEGKKINATPLYPGAIFMPFYVDQDQGWNGEWDSFKDVYQSNWKKEILLFHLGAKPNIYYQLLDEQAKLSNVNLENKTKHRLLGSFYNNQFERNAEVLDINVNIDDFKDEIVNLTNELNNQLEIKNTLKAELIDCFNRMTELNELYENARNNLSELVEDIEYLNEGVNDENIVCPTCGTIHENSVSNRFMMFTEIEECNYFITSYFAEKDKIGKKVDEKQNQIEALSEFIDKIRVILDKKRDNVSFEEIIKHEGAKTILEELKLDLAKLNTEIQMIDGRLKAITKEKTQITKNGKEILDEYATILKDNLLSLDVNDLDRSKLDKFSVSLHCGGNDTPTAILAQIFALNKISNKFSKSVVTPIVLDAIFQQEPAKSKIDLIWEFVISKQPDDSQLIISTTEMHDQIPRGKVITFLNERALLTKDDYEKVTGEANAFKSILLS